MFSNTFEGDYKTAVGVNINQLATFDQPSSLTVTDSARIIICVCWRSTN